MLKNFLMRQMLKRQMKDVPQADQEKVLSIIEKDPDFFASLAEEVQKKTKEGKDQMTAMREVIETHQQKLKGLL